MESTKRDAGLDIIRAVSMFGVVGLHILGAVFAEDISASLSLSIRIAYSLLYCSVNMFALLSGYLYVDRVVRASSIVRIWTATLFWCIAVTTAAFSYLGSMGMRQAISYVFPYSADRLWYITCYTFCFFLIPFMKKALSGMGRHEMEKLLAVLFVLLSVVTTVTVADRFHVVSNGYSGLWICYMLCVGGYLRLYGFGRIKRIAAAIVIFVNSCVLVASTYCIEILFGMDHIERVLLLYRYSSPLIVANSVLLFGLFVDMPQKWRRMAPRLFKWLSGVSFGIYVIHAHPFMLDNIFVFEKLKFLVEGRPPFASLLGLLAVMSAVFVSCGLLEWGRQQLFAALHIRKIEEKIGEWIDRLLALSAK